MPSDQEPAPQSGRHKKVGEDWKEQVRHEKARGTARSSAEERVERGTEEPAHRLQPNIGFLIGRLATEAFIGLGLVENPVTKKKERSLPAARFAIGLLQVLAEKTKGNVSQDEQRGLESVLHELRLCYVDVTRGPAEGTSSSPEAPSQD